MSLKRNLLMRTFGRPQGLLGRLGGRILARTNRRFAEASVALLEVAASDHVLEIGFGPGEGIAAAAQAADFVGGVDVSGVMLEPASARNAAAIAAGRVDLRLGSAEQLPFASASFDKAFAVNSMQIWPDRPAALAEIRRVLKPGGHVAFAFTPISGQKKEGLPEQLGAAGFTQVRTVDGEGAIYALAVNP